MGIKGLLQYLANSQREVNVSSFRGQTAAVDAYCWLHKGCYSCATKLVMKTEKYEDLPFVRYCMKRVNLLRQHHITPIVVFDGAHLPMKHNTESERRERRKSYLQKGKALLKEGKDAEAYNCFQRCVDVTPEMALVFIKELRKYNIQVIVAPYEADAQLAYLIKEGIAQLVITEDSDLLAFGCSKVLFKMDDHGNGKLIELNDIGKTNKALTGFTPDSFRHVCILSGCDYLPSIPGVGMTTAIKLMKKNHKNPYNVIKSLKRERVNKVPPGYEDEFKMADETFQYQVVFDPRTNTQVRLTTPTNHGNLTNAGIYSSPSKQLSLARGCINPITLDTIDKYSPAKQLQKSEVNPKSNSWNDKSYPIKAQSVISVSSNARKPFKRPTTVPEDNEEELDLAAIYGDNSAHQSCETTPPSITTATSKYFSTSNDTLTLLEMCDKSITTINEQRPSEPHLSDEPRPHPSSDNEGIGLFKKRLSFDELPSNDCKRMKLDESVDENPVGVVTSKQLPCPQIKKPSIRLGLSRTKTNPFKNIENKANTTTTGLLSYFSYKSKDKLSL